MSETVYPPSSNFLLWYTAGAAMEARMYYVPMVRRSGRWGNGFGDAVGNFSGYGYGDGCGGYFYAGTVEYRFNYLEPRYVVLF